jgi:hypothetical protein
MSGVLVMSNSFFTPRAHPDLAALAKYIDAASQQIKPFSAVQQKFSGPSISLENQNIAFFLT